MIKQRLSKVCRGIGITVPEGVRILNLYGFNVVRKPNTKLSRLERAVLTLHTTLFNAKKVYLVWMRDDCDGGRDRLYGIYRDKDEAVSYAKDKVWRHATPEVFPPHSDQYIDAKHYCNGNHLIVAVGHDGFWSITVEETPIK